MTGNNPSGRKRLMLVALLALLAGGLGLWSTGVWPFAEDRASPNEKGQARVPSQPTETTEPIEKAQRAQEAPGDTPRANDLRAESEEDHDAGRPKPGVKLAMLFDEGCTFGVRGHCQEWGVQAKACDSGDADACVSLGELLITESPMQPLWGSLLLTSACELGRDEVCERGHQWNTWARLGYQHRPDLNEEIPQALQRTCDEGDQAACGLIHMRLAKQGHVDEAAMMASCRAGFRDVCTALASATLETKTAVAAFKAGCDVPDAYICLLSGQVFTSECRDFNLKAPCPAPDATQHAHYTQLACQLDPDIPQCGD